MQKPTDKRKELEDLFTAASTGPAVALQNLQLGEDIRFNRWAGQDRDGKRHQRNLKESEKVSPWEGYPDGRLYLSDEIIGTLTDVAVVALMSAAVRATPAHVSRLTADETAEVQAMVRWMMNGPLAEHWEDTAELAESTRSTHGCVVLHCEWEEVKGRRYQTVTLPQMMDLRAEGTAVPAQPGAGELALALVSRFGLTEAKAANLADKLLAEGEARVPVEVVLRNGPRIHVLRPVEDVVWPRDTHVLRAHEARWVCFREWMTEEKLRVLAKAKEWAPAWVEAAVQQAAARDASSERTAGPGLDLMAAVTTDREPRIEVRTHLSWELDAEDVRVLRCRVYVPNVEGFAKEEEEDAAVDGYPLVFMQSEVIYPQLGAARGVVDIMQTWESSVKSIVDDTNGRMQVTLNPPLIVRSGGYDSKSHSGTPPPRVGPGAVLDERRYGEARLMPIPPGDAGLGLNMVQYFDRRIAAYFGLPHAELPPILHQLRTQRRVSRTIRGWATALYLLLVQAYQNLDPLELEEILGRPPVLTAERIGKFRVSMKFNSATLDRDWMLEMMQAITQTVLPLDRTGAIDSGKLVPLMLSFLDPVFGQEIASETAGASQRIYREVLATVVSMQQGNEAEYVENDATAPAKLQFLAQILGANPKYLQELAGDVTRGMDLLRQFPGSFEQYDPQAAPDPIFAARLVAYVKHLMFTAQQMGPNRQTGRVGVEPGKSLEA